MRRTASGGSKVRTIFSSRAFVLNDHLFYRVSGSGFLKHMVRNLAGTLLEAGKGNLGAEEIEGVPHPGTHLRAGPTLPARGLFLMEVQYSSRHRVAADGPCAPRLLVHVDDRRVQFHAPFGGLHPNRHGSEEAPQI